VHNTESGHTVGTVMYTSMPGKLSWPMVELTG